MELILKIYLSTFFLKVSKAGAKPNSGFNQTVSLAAI